MSTSASGGYLSAAPSTPFGELTFDQFLQTVLVGISGLPGTLVRPKWQIDPPKQPDIDIDWLAFGLTEDDSDTNAYVAIQPDQSSVLMRMEDLTVECSFYGPNSYEFCKVLRDGFQIKQNLEALQSVNMNFAYTERMVRAPDIVNERWVDRWNMNVRLRREILRTYPILTFISASGILKTNDLGTNVKTVAITVNE